ncbi:MAG: response regulator [Pseudomonadales bacterium]|nr:response regulator [Pseudomonadales bacterium]
MVKALGEGFKKYSNALLHGWPLGLFVVDELGNLVALNPAGEKILEHEETTVLGRDLHSLLCSDAADYQHTKEQCPMTHLLESQEEGCSLEAWWITGTGNFVNVDVTKVLATIPEMDNACVLSFQETSGTSVGNVEAKRLALFAELNPSPILQLNENCGIEFANPEMTNLMVDYGFNDEGLPSVLPDDLGNIVSECIRNGLTLTHKESYFEDRSMVWNFHPVLESVPVVVQVYGLDVTELAQTKLQLRKAKEEAEKANESKSMFLANMSHEMRTPMNSILGFSGLVERTELTPLQVNYVNKIKLSASSLLELINDILDFTKIEAGKLEFDICQFNIRDEVELIADLFSDLIADKGLALVIYVDPHIPVSLMGDTLRIKQILINLVSNAIKFTAQGDVVVEVKLESISDGEVMLRCSVKDSGIGIEKEKINLLFSAFSQADESTTRKYGGTGLGLSISKTLVEMMCGKIGVKSEIGEGSEFFCTLQLSRDLEVGGNYLELENVDFHGRKIGYIETNAKKQAALAQCMSSYNMEVIGFSGQSTDQSEENSVLNTDAIIVGAGKDNSDLFSKMVNGALISDDKYIIIAKSISDSGSDLDLTQVKDPVWIESPVKQSQVILAIQRTLLGLTVEIETRSALDADSLGRYHGVHILVVDDNSFNQELAVDILKNQGITSDVAENGRVALQKMAETHYDIVLMDIQMPVMGGHEAIEIIRKDEKLKDSIVIAMTANAIKGEMEKSIEFGMSAFVTKPIDVGNLFEVMNQYISVDKRIESGGKQAVEKPQADFTKLPTKSASTLPNSLPGMDVEYAIKLIGGREKLFLRLAHMFSQSFSAAPTEIQTMLDERDLDSAERLAHSIKGSAGNLAANELSEAARKLEFALKNKETDLDKLISDFDDHLQVVMGSIEQLSIKQ